MIALNAIENDEDFLENLNTRDYRAQVREQKDEILQSIRRRIVRETRRASFFGSNEVKKMSSFLERFTQGITQEERFFLKVSIVDSPILILSSIEFAEYPSFDYAKDV